MANLDDDLRDCASIVKLDWHASQHRRQLADSADPGSQTALFRLLSRLARQISSGIGNSSKQNPARVPKVRTI
jgi:hypothetical protein